VRRAAVFVSALLGTIFAVLGLGVSSAWAQGEALQGTLRAQGEPVQGVEIRVETADDTPIATAVTDEEGRWEVEVPAAGDYKVTLVADSLPEGISLRNPDRATLTVPVFEGSPRTVLFPLGTGEPPETGARYSRAAQLAFEGLNFGLIISMAAVGLSLIFGTTGLVNFSHGELVTFGALVAFLFNVTIGIPLILAGVVAVVVSGAFGWLQDRLFWGQLRRRGSGLIAMMIISIGVAILLRFGYLWRFGGESRPYADYRAQAGLDLAFFNATPKSLVSIALSIVILVAVGIALLRTRIGKATRAVADNPALAAASGINVDQVIRVVWTVGAALAGLAGVLLAMNQQVNFQLGFQILLLIFAGVVLGGLGTAFGALVGGLVVGMFIQLSTLVVPPELKNVGALAILIVILLVRPQGILGRRERIG
jgi:neutral amino acid transport system permease protein